jgi:hypothetical protein
MARLPPEYGVSRARLMKECADDAGGAVFGARRARPMTTPPTTRSADQAGKKPKLRQIVTELNK